MDLWVRSQDKRALYCVRQLRINGLDIMCLGGELLVTYSTEKRALEVLDDIQNFRDLINHFEVFTKGEARFRITSELLLKYQGRTVYCMPKE